MTGRNRQHTASAGRRGRVRASSVWSMGYGGAVVVAVVGVLLLVLLPHVVDRETAVTQSREFDRFSPRMRLLGQERISSSRAAQEDVGTRGRMPVRAPHVEPGGIMSPQIEPARRPHRAATDPKGQHDAQSHTLREVARLRGRRAARLSREQAAGRRRMLASALLGLATLVMVVLAAASLVGWAWALLPGVLLVAALGLSRTAAIRSERAREAENEQMHRLRQELRGYSQDSAQASARAAAAAGEAPSDGAAAGQGAAPETSRDAGGRPAGRPDARPASVEAGSAAEDAGPVSGDAQRSDSRPDDAQEGEQAASAVAAVHDAPAEDASGEQAVGSSPDRAGESAGTPSSLPPTTQPRPWSVPRLPPPSYTAGERVGGRQVHPDTDIRGVPLVDGAAVPARPVAGERAGRTRSTAEVVATQPVAFDLEAVLDARRAE